jgi:hypothetical protein
MRKNKTMKIGGGWAGQGLNLLGQLAKTSKPQRWAGQGSNLFGRAAKTSNPQQRAVPDLNLVGQAKKITTNPQRGATFMNPQKVNMAQNVFGSARGIFDGFTNNSPSMSWKELKESMSHGAEHMNKMASDGSLAKSFERIPFASHLANKAVNNLSNSESSINAGIRKFSTGRS